MRHLRLPIVFAAVVGLLLAAAPSSAQTRPAADLGVGYSLLRIMEGDGLTMSAGWLVSAAVPVVRWVSIVGEVAGDYRSIDGETAMVHTFQGGLRLVARQNPKVRPYGQFLLGGATASGGGTSETRLSIEPGGGMDIPVGRRVAVRVGVGFPMVFAEGRTNNLFRFYAGLVF